MLAADKNALRQDLRLHMLEIQKRELDYITNNLSSLSTASAVLLGFAITLAASVNEISPNTSGNGGPANFCLDGWLWGTGNGGNPGVQNCQMPTYITYIFDSLFALFTGLALGCNLITLFLSSAVLMAGPGMALRGPEGSLVMAVRHMEAQNKRALRFFGRGLVSFACSMFFLGINYALYDQGPYRGIFLCLTMLWTVWTLLHYGADIMEKFYISPERAVRGKFESNGSGKMEWIRQPQQGHSRRPPGHGPFTPLLRLDKILTFPYYDAGQVAQQSAESNMRDLRRSMRSSTNGTDFELAERTAVDGLLRTQQGPYRTEEAASSANAMQDDLYHTALNAFQEIFYPKSEHEPGPSRVELAAQLGSQRQGRPSSVRFDDGQAPVPTASMELDASGAPRSSKRLSAFLQRKSLQSKPLVESEMHSGRP